MVLVCHMCWICSCDVNIFHQQYRLKEETNCSSFPAPQADLKLMFVGFFDSYLKTNQYQKIRLARLINHLHLLTMAEQEVNQLADQIKKLAATADETTRRNISSTLRQLTVEVESPGESVQRILYPLILHSVCAIANDLNLFEILSDSDGPMTTEELAEKTKCHSILMGRLLRFLAATYTINETGEDSFKANQVTRTFTKPGLRAGLNHW